MRFSLRKYLTPNGRRYRVNALRGYGPDNPRDWDPNHPMLKSPLAPHETNAAMRLHRNGHPNPEILKILKVKGTQLISMLRSAMDEEGDASRMHRPIHDAKVDKGTT